MISEAKALLALPGFPKFDKIGGIHDVGDFDDGSPIWYANGFVWVGVDLVCGEWIRVPLLTHMGTAGILLGMLGRGWLVYQRDHDGAWEVSRPDGEGRQEDPSLGVAVARALVAIGRAS